MAKFVVSIFGRKKGKGKKEKAEKGKKGKIIEAQLMYLNRARRSKSVEENFFEEFRHSGILSASHRHYFEFKVLGIH